MKYIIILFAFMLFPSSAFGSDLKSEEAKILAEELRLSINKTMARIVEYEKQSGADEENFNLVVQQEPVMDSMLGAVLDKNNQVVVISPNSNAKSLGLKVGDIIEHFQINGKTVDVEKGFSLKAQSLLEAKVIRGSKKLALNTSVNANLLPAWQLRLFNDSDLSDSHSIPLHNKDESGCGRISVFFNPPETKRIYPSFISKVNDKNSIRKRETIRLKAGKHDVYLHELIPARELHRRKFSMNKSKLLEINVEPNKTYYLGAKFLRENRYKQRNEEYWEPVIWKVTDKKCKM